METTSPGPFQTPPQAPSPATRPAGAKRVSPAGYWISGAILLLGLGGAVVWFIVAIVGLVNAPDDYDRIAIPGKATLTLESGDWNVYYEYPGANSSSTVGYRYLSPDVKVTGPGGRVLALDSPTTSSTYSTTGGHSGRAIYEFTAPTSGSYTVTVSAGSSSGSSSSSATRSSSEAIAIGRPLFSASSLGGLIGSMVLGVVSFVIGLVVLIVTIVRRSRMKRQLRLATAGQPRGPGGYPPGPYGSGPYPPGAYPPGAYPPSAYPPGAYPPGPGGYRPGYPPPSPPPPTWGPPAWPGQGPAGGPVTPAPQPPAAPSTWPSPQPPSSQPPQPADPDPAATPPASPEAPVTGGSESAWPWSPGSQAEEPSSPWASPDAHDDEPDARDQR